MAKKNFLVDIDLNGNELQNVVMQNLAAHPSNPKAGMHYYNTTDNTEYFFNGTEWVNAAGDYTFQNGLEQLAGSRDVQIKVASGGNAGNVTVTADSNGLKAEVAEGTNAVKGIVRFATDVEATAGVEEEVSVNPKQLKAAVDAVEDKAVVDVVLKSDTTDTLTVTKGDESTADIKIAKVDEAVKATNDEDGNNIKATYATKEEVKDDITLQDLSIAAGSANYLEYNNATGEFGAKVSTSVEASTNLVTAGAVKTYVDGKVAGGIHYRGTWDITDASDYSAIPLPADKGDMYYVTGTGPKTIDGIEWNPADYLLINDDVAAGGSLAGKVEKIDNTEAADIVRLDVAQTLTNKTIDADNNTISNLEADNFKAGVIQTSVRAEGTATDTNLVSEAAVRAELDTKQDKVTAAVENNIATWDAEGNTKDSGKAFVTEVRASASASDDAIATEKAVATFVEGAVSNTTFTTTTPAGTSVAGVVTFNIAHTLGFPVDVTVIETATGAVVEMQVVLTNNNVALSMNSAADIQPGAYTVLIKK